MPWSTPTNTGSFIANIKPGNVMLHRESKRPVVPKLLDMGLAHCLEGAAALRGGGSGEAMTQAGQLVGTIEYMPPEQWNGAESVVPESDLYALGGTLYFALTGKPPFGKGTPDKVASLCMAHANSPPPSVRAARADLPDMLDLLVQQMLSKTPSRRGSPSQLRPQLQQLYRMAAPLSLPSAPPSRPSPSESGSHPTIRPPVDPAPGEEFRIESRDPSPTKRQGGFL